MKKTLLILLIIMVPIAMVSQKKKTEIVKNVVEINKTKTIDSLKNQINLLHSKFADISKEITTVKDLNISTEKKLIYFKSKEDFYVTALANQTNLYILLVTLIVAAGGFLTFNSINRKIKEVDDKAEKRITETENKTRLSIKKAKNKTQKRIKKAESKVQLITDTQKLEFDKKLEKFDSIQEELYLTIGNLNISIGRTHIESENFTQAISFHLKGIKFLLLWNYFTYNKNNNKKPEFTAGVHNFKQVILLIELISKSSAELKKYKNNNSNLLKKLDKIDPKNHTILIDKIAEVRMALNALNEKPIKEESEITI